MAMEVLRPHDCLLDQFRTHPSDVFPRRRGGGRSGRKQVNNVLERKRYGPVEPRRLKSADNLRSSNCGGGLILGKVRILKRGESLDSSLEKKKKKENEAAVMMCGSARLGPDPKEEMKAFLTGRRAGDMYAGSAFVASPSPRDLPVPSFSKKKLELHFSPAADDSATRDLRSLLGLK